MEHIDWELEKENREKKVVARSANKKVTHRGCKLPSDYLTKKEKTMLNGEVVTMEMNKPVKYQIFKFWPTDLQKEYLEKLVREFGASINSVAKMMGVAFSSFYSFLASRHLRDIFPKNAKMNRKQIMNWELFCEGKWTPQNAPESRENALGATNSIEEGTDTKEEFGIVKSPIEAEKAVIDLLNDRVNKQISEPVSTEKYCCDKVQFINMSFSIRDLKSWDDIFDLLRKYPLPEHNNLSIELSERT